VLKGDIYYISNVYNGADGESFRCAPLHHSSRCSLLRLALKVR